MNSKEKKIGVILGLLAIAGATQVYTYIDHRQEIEANAKIKAVSANLAPVSAAPASTPVTAVATPSAEASSLETTKTKASAIRPLTISTNAGSADRLPPPRKIEPEVPELKPDQIVMLVPPPSTVRKPAYLPNCNTTYEVDDEHESLRHVAYRYGRESAWQELAARNKISNADQLLKRGDLVCVDFDE